MNLFFGAGFFLSRSFRDVFELSGEFVEAQQNLLASLPKARDFAPEAPAVDLLPWGTSSGHSEVRMQAKCLECDLDPVARMIPGRRPRPLAYISFDISRPARRVR